MLGNQYFLTRRFKEATTQFERTLLLEPQNNTVKKKLIICYIQQKELKLALKLFTDLISEQIEIFLLSDPIKDDCPCIKMIDEIENFPSKLSELEKNIMLGILWLYCDRIKSKEHFNKLLEIDPRNANYQAIVNIINQPFHN